MQESETPGEKNIFCNALGRQAHTIERNIEKLSWEEGGDGGGQHHLDAEWFGQITEN